MLRTSAPLIGALGVSLKRALAVLAGHACEFRQKFVHGFLLFSKAVVSSVPKSGRVLFALPSDSSRALLVPGPMAALRSLLALAGVLLGPDEGWVLVIPASRQPWLRKRCPGHMCLRCPVAPPELSLCRAGPATKAP